MIGEKKAVQAKEGKLLPVLKKFVSKNTAEFSNIKGNLLSTTPKADMKVIMVTSSTQGEGKTISSLSLAYTLANLSKDKVLLVDGSLKSPLIHKLFGLEPDPGLSDIIADNINYSSAIKSTDVDNLYIMPFGSKSANTVINTNYKNLEGIFGTLRNEYDYIIYDGRSILDSSDTTIIAKHFDGILMVIECEKVKWEVVQTAKTKLESAGGTIFSSILNKRKYYIPKFLYGLM
ncbi:MAG: CpsD/CapB family tyrosine-protein kinase [Candidatus Magnetoovum sp. WYHC-5]|nr:CpsD/CapB family tyrosine-protein kinase [Candidatus Magnetoovum sp. WYHC-5]